MALGITLIDAELRDLVVDLNAAGLETEASCRGRTAEQEFRDKRHLPAAYLTFSAPMPDEAIARLEERGRHVYAGGRAVAAVWVTGGDGMPGIRGYRRVDEVRFEEDFTEATMRAVMDVNARFVHDVREAFALARAPELPLDIAYFGPGLAGKTTNMQYVYARVEPDRRTAMSTIANDDVRTMSFSMLPRSLAPIDGRAVRLNLVTVPGAVYDHPSQREIVETADGIVFVADSQSERAAANVEMMERLERYLADVRRPIAGVPLVLQYNKRDLANGIPRDELERTLNPRRAPSFDAVAREGTGVIDCLKECARLVVGLC